VINNVNFGKPAKTSPKYTYSAYVLIEARMKPNSGIQAVGVWVGSVSLPANQIVQPLLNCLS